MVEVVDLFLLKFVVYLVLFGVLLVWLLWCMLVCYWLWLCELLSKLLVVFVCLVLFVGVVLVNY